MHKWFDVQLDQKILDGLYSTPFMLYKFEKLRVFTMFFIQNFHKYYVNPKTGLGPNFQNPKSYFLNKRVCSLDVKLKSRFMDYVLFSHRLIKQNEIKKILISWPLRTYSVHITYLAKSCARRLSHIPSLSAAHYFTSPLATMFTFIKYHLNT